MESEGGTVAWLAVQDTVALRMDGQKSQLVSKMMVAIIEGANFVEKKTVMKGMTLQLIKTIIESCCEEDSFWVVFERRLFLIMQLFCFFSVSR